MGMTERHVFLVAARFTPKKKAVVEGGEDVGVGTTLNLKVSMGALASK